MLRRGFVQAVKTKRHVDECVLKLQGDFSARTAKDVREIFGLDYRSKHQIGSFSIVSNDTSRLREQERDFLVSAIAAYNRTFPDNQRLKKEVDGFKGGEKQRRFWVEIILRSLLLGRYQGKVQLSSDVVLRYMDGKKLGTSDFVLHRPTPAPATAGEQPLDTVLYPLLIVTQTKNDVPRGTPLEVAACSNLFELYAYYWETAQLRENRPLYGAVTDLNSWIFQKYDGSTFAMCDESLKACAHIPALEDLSRVVYTLIEAGTAAKLK